MYDTNDTRTVLVYCEDGAVCDELTKIVTGYIDTKTAVDGTGRVRYVYTTDPRMCDDPSVSLVVVCNNADMRFTVRQPVASLAWLGTNINN